jgi:hypothetical protein
MSKLVIKFPTRNRPDKFKNLIRLYFDYASLKHEIEIICTFDLDDPTMNNAEMLFFLENVQRPPCCKLRWFYGTSKNKIEASNANLEDAQGDVIMMIADDMVPQMVCYDQIIFEEFAEHFPDFFGAVKFWDGLRPKRDDLMCLQIIGFPLFRQLGHFFWPEYETICCDDDLTETCKLLGVFTTDDRCIIKHEWNRTHFDYVRERTENIDAKRRDQITLRDRRRNKFGLGGF